MNEDPIVRANRWLDFYNEEGGLRDVFGRLRQAYLERAADLMPSDTGALLKLGMAGKLLDQIDAHIMEIVNTGRLEAASREHAERVAKMPEARRRYL